MDKKYYEYLHLTIKTLSVYASHDDRLSEHDFNKFPNDLHDAIDRLESLENMVKQTINNLKFYILGLGEGIDNFQPLYEVDDQYKKLVDSFENLSKSIMK